MALAQLRPLAVIPREPHGRQAKNDCRGKDIEQRRKRGWRLRHCHLSPVFCRHLSASSSQTHPHLGRWVPAVPAPHSPSVRQPTKNNRLSHMHQILARVDKTEMVPMLMDPPGLQGR